MRAAQWGATHLPDNPHFEALPAVVCPGPLSEEEVRLWQLVENLAREDLKPGELAAALLYERCAVLAATLEDADVDVPADAWGHDDPIKRWTVLEQHRRRTAPQLGAPWPTVLRRLGIQMREETAKRLVRAFRTLPGDVSTDMDAHGVTLATRLSYLRLDRGRRDAATEIWEAVKARGRPELLAAAIHEATEHPDASPDDVVEAAENRHAAANDARRAALTSDADSAQRSAPEAEPEAGAALRALRALLAALRGGRRPDRYTAGSLRLHAQELLQHLGTDERDAG